MLAEVPSGESDSISQMLDSDALTPSDIVMLASPTNLSQSTSPLFQPPSSSRWSRSTCNFQCFIESIKLKLGVLLLVRFLVQYWTQYKTTVHLYSLIMLTKSFIKIVLLNYCCLTQTQSELGLKARIAHNEMQVNKYLNHLAWLRQTPLHLSARTAWETFAWWPTCLWITLRSPGVNPAMINHHQQDIL